MKRLFDNILTILISLFLVVVCAMTIIQNPLQSTTDMFLQDSKNAEDNINKELYGRRYLLYPSQLLNTILDKTYFSEMRAYINEQNYIMAGSNHSGNIDYASLQVSRLNDYCKATGRDFAYFILPAKPKYDEDMKAVGIDCHRNETADLYSNKLSEYNVPLLDLRSIFRSYDNYYSFFYRTDYHWTADAGILAAREIVSFLNNSFSVGLNESVLSDEKMIRTVLPSCWVGEAGRKALGPFGEIDDYIILKPSYDTSFSYHSVPHDLYLEGSFDVLTYEHILEQDGIYGLDSSYYYYYLRDNKTPVEITNNMEQNGNILIVKDSFGNTSAPFIALTAHKVTLWDMRSDPDLIAYLEAHPEITTVIIAYSTSFLTTSYMNQFFDN